MPDANKFAKLREIGYTVPITCGLCTYGTFAKGQDWGTCRLYQYDHLKHTGPARDVSIIRFGTCPKALLYSALALGAHAEFLPKQEK